MFALSSTGDESGTAALGLDCACRSVNSSRCSLRTCMMQVKGWVNSSDYSTALEEPTWSTDLQQRSVCRSIYCTFIVRRFICVIARKSTMYVQYSRRVPTVQRDLPKDQQQR